jgi:predicted RNA-binding protein YlxR (DUF448 family)
MSPKPQVHAKHIPQRMCVGCREALAKRSLVRVVRGPDGVRIDPTGKAPGRGAYMHERRSCWQTALRGSLPQALKTELTPSERQTLEAHMLSLAPEDNAESDPMAKAGGMA